MSILHNPRTPLAATIAALAFASVPLQGFGQALEEVVVTAQRRASSVQDTPVAITGLGGDALAKLGFESANDISAQVPNMQVSGPYGDVQPIFSIRGVSMSDYSSNQASPIGVYSDEAYLGAVFIHGMSFFDVDRLEVLRGPQGTLYGKNTTGGAINIITKTPVIGDPTEGNIKVGYGSYGLTNMEGGVSSTLIEDKLAGRVAFKYKRDDGYIENKSGGDNLAQTDLLAGRLVLNWQMTDALNAVFKYTHGANDARATPPRSEARTDVRGLESANPTAPYETNGFIDYTGYDRSARNLDFHETEDNRAAEGDSQLINELDLAILNLNYEQDAYSLVSVTSWSDSLYDHHANTDGSPLRLLEIDWYTQTDAYSQDLRFVSNFDSNVSLIGGVYYGYEETEMQNVYSLYEDLVDIRVPLAKPPTAGQAPFVLDFGKLDQRQQTEKETVAVYSQLRIDFSANFGMDIGLRYTRDTTDQPYINISRVGYDGSPRGTFVPGGSGFDQAFVPISAPPGVLSVRPDAILEFLTDPSDYLTQLTENGLPGYTEGPYTLDSAAPLSATEREWTGKIGLDYRINDAHMVYGSVSRGYRAGSFNGGVYYAERDLDESYASPEYILAYELGLKSDLLDNSLRINSALFFYDYTDQQFINVVGISNYLENAGGSQILGFESEIWWAATDELVIQAGIGILDTEYTELELRNTETLDDNEDTVDLAGNELISAPDVNLNLSVDYELFANDYGYLSLNANASYQADQWFSAYNDAAGYGEIKQEAYWIYNGRLTWYDNSESYQLSLWVKNLMDEEYDTYAINLQASFGYDYYTAGAPRTFGAELTYRF